MLKTNIELIFRVINLKLYVLILLLFFTSILKAQNNTSAFETFTLGINYQSNINRNDFHNYWLSDGGIEGYFLTPFYFGEVQLGISYMPFSAKSVEQPDFTSLLLYLQWGYEFNLPVNFAISFNSSVGLFQMNFDDFENELSPGLLSERELATGLNTTLSYSFYNEWNLSFQLNYLRVFTHKKINLINLGFGLTKKFSSPQWLKDFFN